MPCSKLKILYYSFAVSCLSALAAAQQPLVQVFTLAKSHHLLLECEVCFGNDWSSSCRFVSSEIRTWGLLAVSIFVKFLLYFKLDLVLLRDTQTSGSSLEGKLERYLFFARALDLHFLT